MKIFAAAIVAAGGAALISTLWFDYSSRSGFWTYIIIQGVGFVLAALGCGLLFKGFRSKFAWSMLFVGALLWFVCWSWFLTLGLLIPIPLVFWAALGSVFFLVGALVAGAGAEYGNAGGAAALGVGSIVSTGILAIDPIFASDYSYIPLGVGAFLAGILLMLHHSYEVKSHSGT